MTSGSLCRCLLNDVGLWSVLQAIKRMDAQTSRRGIGNLEEEIKNNVVTAVIKNDNSLEDLSTALRKSLVDPNAWKKADSEWFEIVGSCCRAIECSVLFMQMYRRKRSQIYTLIRSKSHIFVICGCWVQLRMDLMTVVSASLRPRVVRIVSHHLQLYHTTTHRINIQFVKSYRWKALWSDDYLINFHSLGDYCTSSAWRMVHRWALAKAKLE